MDQTAKNMINSATTYLKDNEGNIKLFDMENKRVGTLQILPSTKWLIQAVIYLFIFLTNFNQYQFQNLWNIRRREI